MKLEWDTGGWFGSQLGGTAWILVAAAISSGHDLSTGLILTLLFLIPNIVGSILWFKRKLSCYLSIQILFALCGLSGLLAIYVLDRSHLWLAIQQGGAVSEEFGYVMLTVTVLVVMAWFHLRYGRKPDEPSP